MNQSTALQTKPTKAEMLKRVIIKGDISDLTPEQQISYYAEICERHNLDPLSKPFDFMEITDKKGVKKTVLYANKECAAQLRTNRQVSIYKLEEVIENGVYRVTAYARTPDGREDLDMGVAHVKGFSGATYENALKKAVTQAKRRVTLSICGLGMLDESELDDAGAQRLPHPEAEAVMTDQEALTLSHRSSGLDQWQCGRANAMLLINICKRLEGQGITEDIWRLWLPEGIQSRKDLAMHQAQAVFEDFTRRSRLIDICAELGAKGVEKETMRQRLPGGAQSIKDLTPEQTQDALNAFSHWLRTYNEATEGRSING